MADETQPEIEARLRAWGGGELEGAVRQRNVWPWPRASFCFR